MKNSNLNKMLKIQNIKIILLLIFAFLTLQTNLAYTQNEEEQPELLNQDDKQSETDIQDTIAKPKPVIDTLCFKYQFFSGDTLIYNVTAIDSVIQNMDPPIHRIRTEKLQVVCDSVDLNFNYYLTLSTIAFSQKEWTKNQDTIFRNSTPWMNKRVRIVIDSLGNRKNAFIIDSNFVVSSNGGPFQPYLFFPLKETCKRKGKSWLVQTKDTLFDNGFPPAILEQTSLFRAKNLIVKDNDSSAFISYVKTGKGWWGIANEEMTIKVDDVINSYGELTISLDDKIPTNFMATQEEKMHYTIDDGTRTPSWRYITITYKLESFKRNFDQIEMEIQRMRNELKRRK